MGFLIRSFGTRVFLACSVAVLLWQLAPQAAFTYDIVYVRAPRPGGDTAISRMADVFRPLWLEPGSDLMLLHPDGREEVLVAAGPDGAVSDPCVSFDGQWVYYSYMPDARNLVVAPQYVPVRGADIYKINIQTRQVVRLTNQEYTPNTSIRTSKLQYGVFNMGPCPVATDKGNKIVFTSNRNGFEPPKGYTPVTSQLFVMDEDGSNVELITPMTLGAALHPYQLTDGRVAFSSYESQGLRDNRSWGMWTVWPDGRKFEPLWSAFNYDDAAHFSSQLSNGDVVIEMYYNLNNDGFGAFYKFPLVSPKAPIAFGSPVASENVAMAYTDDTYRNATGAIRYSFTPIGAVASTPFTHPLDTAAPIGPDGVTRVGKVTHPAGAPNNDMLLVWTRGPANNLKRPVSTPQYDAGIYFARNGFAAHAGELIAIKNDPKYNELWPRAVVPYKAIYGIDRPHAFPFLPNDGTEHASLPTGTPYGIVGTSSLYKRDSAPGHARTCSYEGLDPFNCFIDKGNSNWIWQGADAGKYSNEEIAAIRIVMMEPRTPSPDGIQKWFNHANERLRVLGEIPVRKAGSNGAPVLDPEGNPDTSFWARIPADTPFTFQMLDKSGRLLNMAQTWHQVRPGEVRVDCGGCHAHSQKPLDFSTTAAAKMPPVDLTLQPAHDVEFVRDIRPILQDKCVRCHQGDAAPANGLRFDLVAPVRPVQPDSGIPLPQDYAVLARNATAAHGGFKAIHPVNLNWYGMSNSSRYIRKFQSRRSLLMWKLAGARLDGWTNEAWPTEAVPGDITTLPKGANPYLADLDYADTVNHSAIVTDAERRLIATWIDLGAPVDLGGGFWQDEIRPTLTLRMANGELVVGAADSYSGLDSSSLSVTADGKKLSLQPLGDGRWSAAFGTATNIVARVRDKAGNWTERAVGKSAGDTRTTPRPPSGVKITP